MTLGIVPTPSCQWQITPMLWVRLPQHWQSSLHAGSNLGHGTLTLLLHLPSIMNGQEYTSLFFPQGSIVTSSTQSPRPVSLRENSLSAIVIAGYRLAQRPEKKLWCTPALVVNPRHPLPSSDQTKPRLLVDGNSSRRHSPRSNIQQNGSFLAPLWTRAPINSQSPYSPSAGLTQQPPFQLLPPTPPLLPPKARVMTSLHKLARVD